MESKIPRILLMGSHRGGKTSIRKVIFAKTPPQETIFIPATSQISVQTVRNSAFVNFDLVEFPGQAMMDFPNPNSNYNIQKFIDAKLLDTRVGAIIFVLDSQESSESWKREIKKMATIAQAIHEMGLSSAVSFEIFVHKAEGMQDENKTGLQREVNTAISENLDDMGIEGFIQCGCHVTSIYDQSIFECFSKVARKLLPEEGILENLLDTMVTSSRMLKAYMFDMRSKMCIASDSCICLDRHNELCSDMMDIVIDFSSIYGSSGGFDPDTHSVIKLDAKAGGSTKRVNTMILYLRAVADNVALVCVIEQEAYDGKMGLVDYNFTKFRIGVADLIRTKRQQLEAMEDFHHREPQTQ